MNEITLTRMNQMKLYGMHGAFKTAIETGKTDDYTLDQFVSMITDAEWDDRNNRRIQRLIKNARFHYKASVENIIYDQSRNIDQLKILRLAEYEYLDKYENVLLTGSTGAKVISQPPWVIRPVYKDTGQCTLIQQSCFQCSKSQKLMDHT